MSECYVRVGALMKRVTSDVHPVLHSGTEVCLMNLCVDLWTDVFQLKSE